ncbi:MAG: hypothetical protein Q8N35_00120 [Methylococcaceae bacterium]|nr:hypothetical protein [Methylococcaceae bacterium]MDP2393863.1 hypothetical protein [Methylococcaceae bacterium]MDP3017969.1 hypothetical protein [Methylococcaceae bacterium]MDP3391236.1 hypothetical protein [Methylococcaceae bacterium]MDP3930960.1 hypothetical protein [Methylococcaceae bacterium]
MQDRRFRHPDNAHMQWKHAPLLPPGGFIPAYRVEHANDKSLPFMCP